VISLGYEFGFLGYGISNSASLKLLMEKGEKSFFVSSLNAFQKKDTDFFSEKGVDYESGKNSQKLLECRNIVISPGVSPLSEIVNRINEKKINLLTDFDIAISYFPSNVKIIGITGTNGKTTTVELTAHLLNRKYKAITSGNIGASPAEAVLLGILDDLDFVVIEISSFQLHYLKTSFFDSCALLNITQDHLSWHGGFREYINDKLKILNFTSGLKAVNSSLAKYSDLNLKSYKNIFFLGKQKKEDMCDFYIDDSGKKFLVKKTDLPCQDISFAEYNLSGGHNVENAAFASFFACIYGVETAMIEEGINSFKPSEHRLEKFVTFSGTDFINDSKSTNADSLIKAINTFSSLNKRILLLCGGRGKGEDYSELSDVISDQVKKVFICGENTALLEKALEKKKDFTSFFSFSSWDDTIKEAFNEAKSGEYDVVLFSPGGSSFDFFQNYIQRGRFYKERIMALLEGEKNWR